MITSGFWKSRWGFMVKNLLAVLVLGCVVVVLLLLWLNGYTRHGQEVEVPEVKGMYVEEAQILTNAASLRIEVIDSTYSSKVPLGTIVEQKPLGGSHSKPDRVVYVVVNSKSKRRVPLPELRDISCRQAEATLQSVGLGVQEVMYEPSQYKDLVLDVRVNGQSAEPGLRLEEGSKVVLVVGFGQGTEQVRVPDLLGKTKEQIRTELLAARLIPGSVEYDEEVTDENTAKFVVYQQSPRAGQDILEGSRVDVKMTTSLEKAVAAGQQESEDDFF